METLLSKCRRKLNIQIILKWIFLFGLIISVMANFLQLADRMYQQNRINSLQLISGDTDNKIQSSDTATYGLIIPKHKNKAK